MPGATLVSTALAPTCRPPAEAVNRPPDGRQRRTWQRAASGGSRRATALCPPRTAPAGPGRAGTAQRRSAVKEKQNSRGVGVVAALRRDRWGGTRGAARPGPAEKGNKPPGNFLPPAETFPAGARRCAAPLPSPPPRRSVRGNGLPLFIFSRYLRRDPRLQASASSPGGGGGRGEGDPLNPPPPEGCSGAGPPSARRVGRGGPGGGV